MHNITDLRAYAIREQADMDQGVREEDFKRLLDYLQHLIIEPDLINDLDPETQKVMFKALSVFAVNEYLRLYGPIQA